MSGWRQYCTSPSLERQKMKWYLETRYLTDLDRIDGEPQHMMAELRCEPEQFKDQFHLNVIMWETSGKHENCLANFMTLAAYAKKFPHGCWSFLGPGCEKKWCGTRVSKPDGEWDKTAEGMMLNFAESGHPVFCATSASAKRRIEKQRKGSELHSLQR